MEERVTKKSVHSAGRPPEEKPDRVLELARDIFVQVIAQPYHGGITPAASADKCIEFSKAFWGAWDAAEKSNG